MRPLEPLLQKERPALEMMLKERRLDAMSETSEGTTTTGTSISGKSSLDNAEDLRDLAVVLGIANPDDVQQERFRVDRRKLEQMLLGDSSIGESADGFFHKVMEETNTYITWPSRLKIGAKSKKDPHVKVAGLPDNIRMAKDQITQVLDTRQNNRVTMKLDVSYTDHSHIIGKGGLTIKKVMEETSCHIHFPDSNRSNHQEKSNQVSVAGDVEGVEKARARVRNLTPLIFSFELPVMGNAQLAVAANVTPFSNSPYIAKIEEKYNVQIMFRTRPKLHATLVVIKGCEWEVAKVKEATVLLIHHMCENLASQIQVQMSMEISPQHHSVVLGNKSNNLKQIMQRTGTQIMFPDAGDPNIPSLKKSNVTITGSIHNVYLARQQLMGSLPLVLMFDLPEKSINTVMTDDVARLMQTLDVYINVRHKPKQSTLSIVVKGIERNASNIYEARRQLLGLDEPKVTADIPQTYLVPNSSSFILQGGSASLGPFIINENIPNTSMNSNTPPPPFCGISPPTSLHASPNNSMNFPAPWTLAQLPPSLFSPIGLHPNHLTPAYAYPPHLSHLLTMHQQQQQQQQQQQALHNATKLMGLGAQLHSANASAFNSSVNGSFLGGMKNGLFAHDNSKDSSAFSSMSSVSSSLSSPALSPRNVSPIDPSASFTDVNTNLDLSNVLSELTLASTARRTGSDKKLDMQPSLQDFSPMTFEYEQKKLMAAKAMQSKPNPNEFRVPTSVWSGYGLSQTTPAIGTAETNPASLDQTSSLWKDSPTSTQDYGVTSTKDESSNNTLSGMTSNYLDHTSSFQIKKITTQNHTDLPSLLTSVGLEKYIRLFASHEVDMATFTSLAEKDLCEIGITAWGARRKIMLLISELNKRTSSFSGSAAPGAERKLASSGTPTTPVRKNSLESSAW